MKNTLSEKFICSCRQISNKKYEDYTINNQSSSFDQINQTLGVAITCGACLLNAELLYLKLSEKNNITINNWTNHKFKKLFNKISKKYFFSHYNNYFKKKIIVQTAPIFSGKFSTRRGSGDPLLVENVPGHVPTGRGTAHEHTQALVI